MNCKIHPNVELREGFATHKIDWCWACSEAREMEWGKENPETALKKWAYELEIAKSEKKFAEVDAISRRINQLKREI